MSPEAADSTLDSKLTSAVALLSPAIKDELLLNLAAKDVTFASLLLNLAGANIEATRRSIEGWNRSSERLPDGSTLGRTGTASLEEGVVGNGASIERLVSDALPKWIRSWPDPRYGHSNATGVIWMNKILAVDQAIAALGKGSLQLERPGVGEALTIIRDRCVGRQTRNQVAAQFDKLFSSASGFDRVFSGHFYDSVRDKAGGAHRSGTFPPPPTIHLSWLRRAPGRASLRSTTLLLSFPTEIIRLILKLGASSLLPGIADIKSHRCLHQARNSYLKHASLVHSLWKNQAQAELVTLVHCTRSDQLLRLAAFLEQSNQVCLLQTLGLDILTCWNRQEEPEVSSDEMDEIESTLCDSLELRIKYRFGLH